MNDLIVTGSTADLAKKENISLAHAFVSVDALLLVDLSSSMDLPDAPGRITRRECAKQQLINLQQKHAGRVGVIGFGTRAEYLPGGYIDNVDLGGTTNMLAALELATPANYAGIPTVLISDGEPDFGIEHDCIATVKTFTAPLHCIYVGPEGGGGYAYLRQLADAARGGGTAAKSAETGTFLKELNDVLLLK